MSDEILNAYDVDNDKVVEKLRALANGIEKGGTMIEKICTSESVANDKATHLSVSIDFMTNNPELTNIIKYKSGAGDKS